MTVKNLFSNRIDISQNANDFSLLQEYRLKNQKKHCKRPSKCKFCKKQNYKSEGINYYKIDICLISKTTLDQSFPNQQFQIHWYKNVSLGEGQIWWKDTILFKLKNSILRFTPKFCYH